ncbi:MAG: YrhB domain-containing protein, partial [Kibdelosporangium sp.]
STYGGSVVLDSAQPVHSTGRAVFFGCRHAESDEPMLAATICVPVDGRAPFPVSNAAPLDEDINLATTSEVVESWRWRVNARNCVVAMKAAAAGSPASAAPWQAKDESPGWWDRLLSEHIPDAEVTTCEAWQQVSAAIVDGGPRTHGVAWLRRSLNGRSLTGHLLYTAFDEESGGAVLFDPQRGTMAVADDSEVESIVLARFHQSVAPTAVPWETAADDFAAAVAKASGWLDFVYGGKAALVEPDPADETRRGWLFACTSRRFMETGDWRHQMLDAAVLVPKAAGESPFGLPNRDPWTWLREWDGGANDLPEPPDPGNVTWFGPLADQIDGLTAADPAPHSHWAGALTEISGQPADTAALVWLRRRDNRGRESVGHLLWAINRSDRIEVFDPTADAQAPADSSEPFELLVFPVETPPGSVAAMRSTLSAVH